jgi:hypothetical protein
MTTRTTTVILTGDAKQYTAEMDKAALKSEETSKRMGDSMEGATERTGNAFERLGSKLDGLGIPGGSAFEKIGSKISEADTKGQKFGQMLSTIGGVTLAAGAAGLVAFGAESVEMADKFDVAQAQLKVAVTNAGGNFDKLKPKIDATYQSMSSLGFNAQDSASALTTLTTATGNPTKAMALMGQAADLARYKHISLADASQALAKVQAGSTRVLTQMGINLDIGSGKLAAIHTATEGVTKAQMALHATQDKIAAGTLKGTAATDALKSSQLNLSLATQKLHQDQTTTGTILDALAQKTKGAAAAYGQTMAGQMDVAKAKVHNLGISFGEFLIPKIETTIHVVSSVITWFSKHKAVAEALAAVIGAVLGAAVIKFSVETAGKLVGGVKNMASSMLHLGDTFTAAAGQSDEVTEASALQQQKIDLLSERVSLLTERYNVERNVLGEEAEAKAESTKKAIALEKAMLSEEKATLRSVDAQKKLIETTPETDESLASIAEAMEKVKAQAAEMSEAMGETEVAEGEFAEASEASGAAADTAFGPIGIILMGLVTIGTLIVTHWKTISKDLVKAWDFIKDEAVRAFDWLKSHLKVIAEGILIAVTGPVGLLVVELYKHWSTVKHDVVEAFDAVVDFVTSIPHRILSALDGLGKDIEDVFRDAWHLAVEAATEELDLLRDLVVTIPEKVISWVAGLGDKLWDWAKGAFEHALTGFEEASLDIFNFVTGLPDKILGFLGDAGSKLLGWGEGLIHGLVTGIENVAGYIGHAIESAVKSGVNGIPVIGGLLSHIPGFATGGYVTAPTLALIGEKEPEFIIPQSKFAQMAATVKPLTTANATGLTSVTGASSSPATTTGAAAAEGVTINQYISAPTDNPEQVQAQAAWKFKTAAR